jgi:hypothetical protein
VFIGISGSRLWQVITALEDVGLVDLTRAKDSASGIGVIRLHPLVRDTSRPDAATDDGLTLLTVTAALLERATTAPDTGHPEDPPTWPIWRLLTPHAAQSLDALRFVPADSGAARETANAAFRAAQNLLSQGLYAQSRDLFGQVLSVRIREGDPDDPLTLTTRYQLARVMAEQGRHADAESEYRDVLSAELRVLGPDHPSTLATKGWVDYFEERNHG